MNVRWVLVGTFSGVFETLDGAKTWKHVEATAHWGVANSFRNGTINGKSVILVGANAGLGNVPLKKNEPLIDETWSLIPAPKGSSAWRTNVVSVADFVPDRTAVGWLRPADSLPPSGPPTWGPAGALAAVFVPRWVRG